MLGTFVRFLDYALPWVFMPLAGAALLAALYFFWQSFRAALGLASVADIPGVVESETRRVLLEKKKRLLADIADLAFERDADKIGEDDFTRLDTELRQKAKRVMQLLDEDVKPFRRKAVAMIAQRLATESRTPYRDSDKPFTFRDDDKVFSGFADILDDLRKRGLIDLSNVQVNEEGADVTKEALASVKQCDECEAVNELDADFCKKCGVAFETDEAPVGEGAEA